MVLEMWLERSFTNLHGWSVLCLGFSIGKITFQFSSCSTSLSVRAQTELPQLAPQPSVSVLKLYYVESFIEGFTSDQFPILFLLEGFGY